MTMHIKRMAMTVTLLLSLTSQAQAQDQAPAASAGSTEQDKARARDAFRRATHHYDFGEYQQALDAFKEAYNAYEDPGLLFNIAQCHRQLGQTEEALRVYRSYLRNAKNPPNVEEVKRLIARLESTRESQRRDSRTPPQGTIAPGRIDATAPATGAPAETQPATQPQPTTQPPPATTQPPTPATTQPNTSPQLIATPHDERPLTKKPWFWATVAGGVVVVAAAIVVGVVVSTRSPANPNPTITTINGN
jgi:hypothetical protein